LRDSKTFDFNNVVLSERSGQQIVNTLLPLDAKLPVNASAAADELVFRTGKRWRPRPTGTPAW